MKRQRLPFRLSPSKLRAFMPNVLSHPTRAAWPALLAVLLPLSACVALLQPDRTARAPVLEGFGTLAWPITTPVPEAQALFTRGMLQSYAFNENEAARTFKAALAKDLNCAMCAWGVAYALGPNINSGPRGDVSEARRYAGYAKSHLAGATPREVALVEALVLRYADAGRIAAMDAPLLAATCGKPGVEPANPLDVAYARKMRELSDAYPTDPDITSFFAEAVIIATPDVLWDRKTGAPSPDVLLMVQRLEAALARTPEHTGLNHYLVHAMDSSPTPEVAAVAADRLGRLAPESPHLVHMPSHVYVRLGRYGDARRVNEEALAAELRQTALTKAQGFETVHNWDRHNTHFLWFAALMDGRGEQALAQARQLSSLSAKGKSAYSELMRSMPLLTLVRLGRFDEALKEPPVAGDTGMASGVREYARGVALARTAQPAAARDAAAALKRTVDAPLSTGQKRDEFQATALAVLSAQLQGEIEAASGDVVAMRATLQRAAELEDALEANEPPILGAASRIVLGDALLRAGRGADAEAAFKADLQAQPGNGWALRGLLNAVERQGRMTEAADLRSQYERAWVRADAALRTRAAPGG